MRVSIVYENIVIKMKFLVIKDVSVNRINKILHPMFVTVAGM